MKRLRTCRKTDYRMKRLRTCRKTDYRMKRLRTCRKTDCRINEYIIEIFRSYKRLVGLHNRTHNPLSCMSPIGNTVSKLCEILVFRVGVYEVSALLGYDATSLGISFPTFRDNLVVSSSRDVQVDTDMYRNSVTCDRLTGNVKGNQIHRNAASYHRRTNNLFIDNVLIMNN
jgi:hypothetical protein